MRLTCNAQKFMAAIAAIAMFCFGPAMASETVFVKNGDSYVTKDDNVIYRMTKSPAQTTEACSSVDGLDVKNGDVTVVNGDLDGLYEYGDVAKFECNKGVKKTYYYKKSGVTLDLTSAKAGRAFPTELTSIDIARADKINVLNENMKVKKVYENCPNNKVPGNEIGKDESKCYEKVTIYDVRVACRALQKAGDGKSSVYMQLSFCAATYSGVTASKDKCYDISGDKLCSYSENGDAPSTSESATCYDGFTKKTHGTFYKSETDSVTAQSNRPYCTNPTSGYFYGNPSERPYTEYYDASVTLYEDCSYADVNGLTSDKKGVAGKGIVAKQNGETVCYMKDKDGCYEIGTAFELYGFANVVNNATYGSQICGTLTKDIVVNTDVLNDGTLNGVGSNFTPWTPMNVKSGVQVTLNGNGKTISGLYFNDENQDNVGLFGDVLGTVSISNLGVKDSYFKGGFNVGGLVGCSNGESLTIENSYNSGTVSGSGDHVGGLVGDNGGENAKLTIKNSYNAGPVSGSGDNVGGLVGCSNGESLTIENSYNSGTVSGVYYVGGLVGRNNGGSLSIENSYNAGTVSGSKNNVGGLVGRSSDAELTIANSYNEGSVSGSDNVGGLVGCNNGGSLSIENSYNSGTVSGSGDYVGGLVGDNGGENAKLTITNSFFVAAEGVSDELGGEAKTLEEFHNGTVAFLLHNWCEMDGDNCKVGGLNGSIWGQDFTKENSLPDLSGKFVGGTPHTLTLHTFEGDTRKLPTIYLGGKVLKLPTDLTRENHIFLGWSAKETAGSSADIVTSIAKNETGAKEFYAQWMKVNEKGCYEIASGIGLYTFAGYVYNAPDGSQVCGTLTKDIVVNENVLTADGALNGVGSSFTPWTPMNVKGSVQVAFDGNGKTISGLYFNDENQDNVGLFGDVLGTVSISNLGVKDSYFKGGFNVGGLVGRNNGGSLSIENSYNAGTVSGSKNNVGGLVGRNEGGTLTIENSYNSGTVSGSGDNVGGLVGISSGELSIKNSYNSGTVSGSGDNVGGLVGGNVGGSLSIENSYNEGTVSGNKYVGGLVGYNNGGTLTITNSYNAGTVSCSGNFVGGLVGYNHVVYDANAKLTITNSYNAGTVSCSGGYVGGLVGLSNGELTITNSFFLATGVYYGGTETSLDDFHNGTVALLLHNWCEMDGDNCKEGGLKGTIWGQDVLNGDVLPNFSGKINVETYELVLNTFEGDTRKYPTEYLSVTGLVLPMALERENHIFLGWSLKEVAESSDDIVTSIAKGETGAKTFYAQWKKLNANGCFEISSTFDLYAFANVVNNATNGSKVCGTLAENIVVNENVLTADGALNGGNFTPWNPMTVVSGVKVTFDGNGKTISGLYFNNGNQDNVGLFVDVRGELSISDLGVKDSYFRGGWHVGGLVGDNGGELTITNSYNAGAVSGSGNIVGGLVGYNVGENAKLTITNSYNAGTVSGSGNFVGGLVGWSNGENAKLTITNSYNAGTVSGDYFVGGLVGCNGELLTGYNAETLTITNSYNAGTVSGSGNFVGGLVGWSNGENAKLTITNSYNAGAVSGSGDDVGGLVGGGQGTLTITNSFFVATGEYNVYYGGTETSLDDFHNGTVAFLLHNWCEMDGDNCKEGGKNGSVWGQDFTKENSLPDLSGKFVGRTLHTLTLHTFKGDTRKLPTIYLEGLGLELPTGMTREGYIFLGWSTKEKAASPTDIVTSIAKDETGAKTFYAQWMKVNEKGCYEIASGIGLYTFASYVNNATNGSQVCGTLAENIVVNENVLTADGALNGSSFTPWNPMTVANGVQVTLDGNGHTISGLYFNDENQYNVGLFGCVLKGKLFISNLGIVDSYFRGEYYVGSFVGLNSEGDEVLIANSYNAGTVSGNDFSVGGLVGGNGVAMGFVGMTITNSYNTGAVSGDGYVGGLVGENAENTKLTITNSYNAGAVSGSDRDVGGLVGISSGELSITNSYNAGAVSGSGDNVGGVVGYNYNGTVSNVYNTGAVSGVAFVGGVVGYNDGGTVSNVYNTGSVSGSGDYVGGVVGNNYGTVSNAYNTGSVSGSGDDVGGVVGCNFNGTVSNVYNTGSVSGNSVGVGGVIGANNGTVSNGFFNKEETCEGCADPIDDSAGKTAAEFADGTVARLLHDWCEKDVGSDECKYGGLNGSIWGQDLAAENSLPDFSGMIGFKYGSITFFNLNDYVADSASIDATAKDPVSILENIAVSEHVTFKRPFAGKGFSTIMLPFSVSEENMPSELKFYRFDKVEEINGKYTAIYDTVKGLNAHTPYIVWNRGEDALSQVTFEGEFTLGTSVMPPPNSSSSVWEFNGTYKYKTWEKGDAGLGRTYGFAANDGVNNPKIVGQFAKVGAGAHIYPMRAYLEYVAPAKRSRPAANGAARAFAANTVASLPETINVVIVDKDEKTGEQTTRVIGTINTRTGEFKFADDRWFDLQGRYLGEKKPSQKGAYYNNGKKVIVK